MITHGIHRRRILFSVLLLALLLAACGPAASAPEPVTLVITSSKVGKDLVVLQQQLDVFMQQHPNIHVLTRETPDTSAERLALFRDYFSKQDAGVDVYMIDIVWPAELYSNGWIIALDELMAKASYDTSDFLRGPLTGTQVSGKQVALPWYTDAGLLYYRKDLLDKYGLPVPTTWDELQQTALTIKAKAGLANGFVWQAAPHEGLTCNALEFVWSYGGTVIDADDQLVFDSPATVSAYAEMQALLDSGASPHAVVAHRSADSTNLFTNGDAVFMRNWPVAWGNVQASDSKVKDQVGVAPLPHGPGGTSAACLGGWNLAISAYSKHPQEAFTLIEFLTSADQQIMRAVDGDYLPTRASGYKDAQVLKTHPFFGDLLPIFLNATPRPRSKQYGRLSEIIYSATSEFLDQGGDPATTVTMISTELEALINTP